jgi:hypothetical protein
MALLSQYGFNEGSGLVSADSSGNGYDLTALNSSTSWDPGGKNGAGAKVKHSGILGPNTSQTAMTVMAWVKRTGTWTGYAGIVTCQTANFFFECNDTGGTYTPNFYGGNGNSDAASGLTLNTWVHIAATADGTSGQYYINGSASGSAGAAMDPMNFGINTWRIVCDGISGDDGENDNFVGIVDEVRIFNSVLTAGEITTWMNTPIPPAPDTGLAWIKA